MTRSRVATTTSVLSSPLQITDAIALASELETVYAPRAGQTLPDVANAVNAERLLVVESRELRLFEAESGTTYAYHPNLLPVRAASVLRGVSDLFLLAMNLVPGDMVLDCTLGFGTEATLASFAVGPSGKVVGLESVPELAMVTRRGIKTLPMTIASSMENAMRRIQVVTADAQCYLADCLPRSVDVIYFDPFFGERLPGSESSVGPLVVFGDSRPLALENVIRAQEVARKRVVLKTPKHERLPSPLTERVLEVVMTHKSRVAYHIFRPSGHE